MNHFHKRRAVLEDNPMSIREELRKDGYSREEEYFYRLNRELIEDRRRRVSRGGHRPALVVRPPSEEEQSGLFGAVWRFLRRITSRFDFNWRP